jgi:hypothetical protein
MNEFLIFVGIFIGLFLVAALIAFVLRDKTGERGYEKPPSCSKCQKAEDPFNR